MRDAYEIKDDNELLKLWLKRKYPDYELQENFPRLYKHQKFYRNGETGSFYLVSHGEYETATQLVVDEKYMKILKKVLEKKNFDSFSREEQKEFDELFNGIKDDLKDKSKLFGERIEKWAEKVFNGEKLDKLFTENEENDEKTVRERKMSWLKQVVALLSRNGRSAFKVGETTFLSSTQIQEDIKVPNRGFFLIDTSVTGMYEKKREL